MDFNSGFYYPGAIHWVGGCPTSSNNEAHTEVRLALGRPIYSELLDIPVHLSGGS